MVQGRIATVSLRMFGGNTMSKNDPQRSPLKGSVLSVSIVTRLSKVSLTNPDAPGFNTKREKVELVRHLMWALRASQEANKLTGKDISISGFAEVLSLTNDEAGSVIYFLERIMATNYYRIGFTYR